MDMAQPRIHLSAFFAAAMGASFMLASSAFAAAPASGVTQSANSPDVAGPALGAAVPKVDAAELKAISRKLDSITTLKADFTQIDAQGTAHGTFYLARPGGLRFQYDPPRHLLVVSNDHMVVVQEHKGTAGYNARVQDTPLRFLLKPELDLTRDANIVDVHEDEHTVYLTAVETKGYGQGQVTFMFSKPDLMLRSWVVMDPTGNQTSVTLSNVETGMTLSKSLFKLPRPPQAIGPPR
jgi:outer membrane lipoprotein-sorting protein